MDEGKKRSLRNRRPPNYLVTEVRCKYTQCDDLGNFGFAHSNFPKEYISPALELNSAAKLLAKFINSTNKHLFEKIRICQAEEKALGPNPTLNQEKPSKKTTNQQEGGRKKYNLKSDPKDDGSKNSKDLYSFKDQYALQGVMRESQRPYEQINKDKSFNRTQKQIRAQNFMPNDYAALLSQFNSQNKNLSGFTNQNHLQAANKAIQQQQNYLTNSMLFRGKIPQSSASNMPAPSTSKSGKLFKRASYHVAIAYHIHLKKVQENGGDLQKELDPTYQAKKLRNEQENDRNTDGNQQ